MDADAPWFSISQGTSVAKRDRGQLVRANQLVAAVTEAQTGKLALAVGRHHAASALASGPAVRRSCLSTNASPATVALSRGTKRAAGA